MIAIVPLVVCFSLNVVFYANNVVQECVAMANVIRRRTVLLVTRIADFAVNTLFDLVNINAIIRVE